MSESPPHSVEDLDFNFRNQSARLVANRSYPEVYVAGAKIGPLQEGREFEVKWWIAEELVEAGIASFHEEELLNLTSLTKVHWRETIQTGRRISGLPEKFYPKLRRYLTQLKERGTGDTSQSDEYDQAVRLAHDVVNCRLKKVVGLAASPTPTEMTLQGLSEEERALYDLLHGAVDEWKSSILRIGGH